MNRSIGISSLKETFGYSDDEMEIINEVIKGISNDDEYIRLKYCFVERKNMDIFRIKIKDDFLVIVRFKNDDNLYLTRESHT